MTRIPRFTNFAKNIFNKNVVKKFSDPRGTDPAVKIAIVSAVSKDAVQCIYYVVQSLKNERIPEDQRAFVAALDLSNGLLNVTLQAAAGVIIDKKAAKFFDKKIAPKYFSDDACKEMHGKLKSNIKLDEFKSFMSKNKGFAKRGFGVITTLVLLQVVIKRILVPFIATPLASVFKARMEKNIEQRDQMEDKFEKIEDKVEDIKDNIEDRFELQNDDD